MFEARRSLNSSPLVKVIIVEGVYKFKSEPFKSRELEEQLVARLFGPGFQEISIWIVMSTGGSCPGTRRGV